mmetsp:Transcript_70339/g.205712  ORF Transcript_70339/g.205712 Transcript_70339/m.205712 type:complete len:285 (-) Transcript_70339:232-1086(-)
MQWKGGCELEATLIGETRRNERTVTFDLTILTFRGQRGERQTLSMLCDDPSMCVAYVKERVLDMLGIAPDEVVVLVDGVVLPDTAVVLDSCIHSRSQMLVMVGFRPAPAEWSRVEPDYESTGYDDLPGPLHSMPSRDPNSNTSAEQLLPAEQELGPQRRPQRPPPPLLMQKRGASEPRTSCERSEPDAVGLVQYTVHCIIFLGQHWHRRSCPFPLSAEAKVSTLEQNIKKWLGSEPDELLLTVGAAVLESHSLLSHYHTGDTTAVSAMAWYKDAQSCRGSSYSG